MRVVMVCDGDTFNREPRQVAQCRGKSKKRDQSKGSVSHKNKSSCILRAISAGYDTLMPYDDRDANL